MAKVIGIDLGTTNSCMAVLEGGEPTVIPNTEGGRTTPSVVAFSKTGERLVGQVAKRQAITNPERTIASIKRKMGTFDVSILEIGGGVFEVKATSGNTHLGGDDWDERVIDWMADDFKAKTGIDLRSDKMALQRLKEAAEKAKMELSTTTSTSINLPFITATQEGPQNLDVTLSRSEFNKMTADLVDKCVGPFKQAVDDSGICL